MSTKELQGKLWSVAPKYWSQYFEPYFLPMYKRVLSRLTLNEDTLVLDAGCGSGLFSFMAIQKGAQVIGIDAAPGLLEIARNRNPGNSFLEEDLETLPFTNNTFDVVAGFNAFQYAGDIAKALKEAKRVLKPLGKLIIGMWDRPERSEATEILKAITTLLPLLPPGNNNPFELSEDGKIEGILGELQFSAVDKQYVGCPMLFHSLSDAVKSFVGTAPAAAASNYTNPEIVRETITKAFSPFRLTEDLYHLQNQFMLFIAEK